MRLPTRASRRKAALFVGLMLATPIFGFAGLLGGLYFRQESLLFPSTPLAGDYEFSFDQNFAEVRIPVNGAVLDALYFSHQGAKGLVFFLHGNRGNITTWTKDVSFYCKSNFDFFIVDYRGYGKSSGHIDNEQQLHSDVRAAWDSIAPRYLGKPTVIYGRSIGTGLAAALARDVAPQLLILVAPYSSVVAMAHQSYPMVPQWLLKYPLRTDVAIGQIDSPILLIHGTKDQVVPYNESTYLKTLAQSHVELLTIEGAGHNDIQSFPAFRARIAERLSALGAR